MLVKVAPRPSGFFFKMGILRLVGRCLYWSGFRFPFSTEIVAFCPIQIEGILELRTEQMTVVAWTHNHEITCAFMPYRRTVYYGCSKQQIILYTQFNNWTGLMNNYRRCQCVLLQDLIQASEAQIEGPILIPVLKIYPFWKHILHQKHFLLRRMVCSYDLVGHWDFRI